MSPFKKKERQHFFPPLQMVERRFITPHIIKTAHNGFCMFSPELPVYIF